MGAGDLENFISEAWEWASSNLEGWVMALFSAAVVSGLVTPLRRWFFSKLWQLFKWLLACARALPQFLKLRSYVLHDRPLWTFRRSSGVNLAQLPPALTVMNFKGGVGKTTVTANLAASFAEKYGLNVLLIDLDYQASLSDVLRDNACAREAEKSVADWISTSNLQGELEELSEPARGLSKVRLIPARQGLSEIEENQFMRWLLKETKDDVRTRLFRNLKQVLSKSESSIDLILMDAPPRLSLSSINALRASDYVIVPTQLQPLSVLPVAKLIEDLAVWKDKLRAKFKIGGIICNLTTGANPRGAETEWLAELSRNTQSDTENIGIFNTFVPDRVDIGRPRASHLAYLVRGREGDVIRECFDKLAAEIAETTGLGLEETLTSLERVG